ncbi:hypothetical protein LCGC14_1349200 [marine sediment metagenome]|uniref:Uncharacterized protein n=1 Tax=marine sediment metagenome TaxID=412755 RepID=A0A0F9KC39_9ZZZZ
MTDPTDPDFVTKITNYLIVIAWLLGIIAGWFIRGVF